MPIDPSIALSVQSPQFNDPLDTVTKALTMKNLMQKNQIVGQQISDDQSTRDAFMNNVKSGNDGKPTIDRAGVLSDLAKNAPMQYMNLEQKFKESDLKQMQNHIAMAKNIVWSIPTDAMTPLSQKQAAWENANAQAKAAGLPGAANSPQQYPGDSFVNNMKNQTLTADEQIKQQNTNREFGIKDQEAQNKAQELALQTQKMGVEASQYKNTKQFEANQQVGQAMESGRQAPDAAQALRDRQSASKLNELVSQAPGGDLNKLSDTQVNLALGEAAKMALSGVPGEAEMKKMDPGTAIKIYGKALSKVTNQPEPANAGQFVKQLQDYASGISLKGGNLLLDRSNRIVDQRRSDLGEANYQQYKQGINNEFADVIKSRQGSIGSGQTIMMKDPQGNLRAVPIEKRDAALRAGGSLVGGTAARPAGGGGGS